MCAGHFGLGCGTVFNSWFSLRAISWELVSFSLLWFVWTNNLLKHICQQHGGNLHREVRVFPCRFPIPPIKWCHLTTFSIPWCLGIGSRLAPNAPSVASGNIQGVQDWFPLAGAAGRCWGPGPRSWLCNWSSLDVLWEAKMIAEPRNICKNTFPPLTQWYYREP